MESMFSKLTYKLVDTSEELKRCMQIRYNVYCEEKKWLSPSHYPTGMECDEYDEKAPHIMALDGNNEIVGVLRLLSVNDYKSIPFMNHPGLKGKKLRTLNGAEVSRLIVNGKTNRSEITRGLLRYAIKHTKDTGHDFCLMVVEPSLVRYLERFHIFLEAIGSPSNHFGGFTLPAVFDLKKHDKIWATKYPEVYAYYHEDPAKYIVPGTVAA